MIEAGLEFDYEVGLVVAVLAALPPKLRPIYFSHDEKVGSNTNRLADHKKFAAFLAKSKLGFFLLCPEITYSIRIAVGKPLVCDCFIDLEPEYAEQFLAHMATAKPRFGFACMPAEREHRNRVTTQQGANKIESWVGRDTQKYLPGFYWLTLLSDGIARQHGISFSAVEVAAQEHVMLEGGQHLFRFYQRPEDWSATSTVAQLCASLSGVFNIEKVTQQLQSTKNFLELSASLKNWK
jgi:hypothetical protein